MKRSSADLGGIGTPGMIPGDRSRPLLERVVAGDAEAWTELVARVHPTVLELCRRRRLGQRLPARDDLHRDVALRTLHRIRADDFAALRRFLTTSVDHASASFVRWLSVVVAHMFIDVLRAEPQYQRTRDECERRLVELELVPLREASLRDDHSVELERTLEVRRIIARLADPAFPEHQRRALVYWLQGETPAEIARALSLPGPTEANKLLHAARQRLRRSFESRAQAPSTRRTR